MAWLCYIKAATAYQGEQTNGTNERSECTLGAMSAEGKIRVDAEKKNSERKE